MNKNIKLFVVAPLIGAGLLLIYNVLYMGFYKPHIMDQYFTTGIYNAFLYIANNSGVGYIIVFLTNLILYMVKENGEMES